MKKYINAVKRRLNLPREIKDRVVADLVSSIRSRQEAGQTDEEIITELGSPAAAAAELNAQMKDFAYQKSPWRWACLALSIACLLSLVYNAAIGLINHILTAIVSDESLAIIGGADGPTAIFVTAPQENSLRGFVLTALVLSMSVIGFYFLGHMKKK